jgi:exoribonuclease R
MRQYNTVHQKAERNTHDPDAILGIRQDLRHQKVYTIDSPSTKDIDDGISVEAITDPSNNKQKLRYWIHIADVDRWAPRGSELLKVAERRGTSLYLPGMTLDMFPEK